MNPFQLKVWRLHPDGCKVIPAEKTLNQTANAGAIKWCQPYTQANALGWWLTTPTDIDIMWKGKDKFEYRHITEYTNDDHHLVKSLVKESDQVDIRKWCPPEGRTKFTWGAVEKNVVQLWTGLILQTPPGWCLHIRSPINCELPHQIYHLGSICSVQEGIIESDWLFYDIWVNLKFNVTGKWVYLRKGNFPPLAHIVPVHRDSLEKWSLEESMVERDTPEGEKVFKYWIDYNHKKYGCGGKQHASSKDYSIMKDSSTYHKEKKKALSQCPFAKETDS